MLRASDCTNQKIVLLYLVVRPVVVTDVVILPANPFNVSAYVALQPATFKGIPPWFTGAAHNSLFAR